VHPCRASVKGAAKAGGLILAAIVLIQRFDGDPDLAANLTRGEGAGPDLIFVAADSLRMGQRRAGLLLRQSPERGCQQEVAILPRRTAHGSVRLRQAPAPVPSNGIALRATPPVRRAVCARRSTRRAVSNPSGLGRTRVAVMLLRLDVLERDEALPRFIPKH
jgi:hypothetical protein